MNPAFVDPLEARVAMCRHHCRPLLPSKMFLIKRGLEAFRDRYPQEPVFDASQGDGGVSLSPIEPCEIIAAVGNFLSCSHTTAYGTPEGDLRVRQVIFERYYQLHGSGLTPANIVTTCGGRDALQKIYQGIALVTRTAGLSMIVGPAPWQSYAQGGYLSGMNMLRAPITHGTGFMLTSDAIAWSVDYASSHGSPTVGLILTTPDNPTGTFLSLEEIVTLIQTAAEHGIPYIVLDLMYEMVLDEGLTRYNVAELLRRLTPDARHRLIVLGGLTKAIGASNVRHAHLLCGNIDFARVIVSVASHTVLTPAMSEAIAYEFYQSECPEKHSWARRVIEPTALSRALFRAWVVKHRQEAIVQQGYYAFLNVAQFLQGSIRDVDTLATHLTSQHGLAVIPGSVFHQSDWIRFSLANTPKVTQGAIDRLDRALSLLT